MRRPGRAQCQRRGSIPESGPELPLVRGRGDHAPVGAAVDVDGDAVAFPDAARPFEPVGLDRPVRVLEQRGDDDAGALGVPLHRLLERLELEGEGVELGWDPRTRRARSA